MAVLQLAGRILFLNLGEYETWINSNFQSDGVSLVGLRGDWYGLNPVIEADQIFTNLGELNGVTFEVDILESLLHNGLVARRLHVESAYVRVHHSVNGWRVGNGYGYGAPFDLTTFIRNSDSININALIVFERDDLVAPYEVSLTAINRFGIHRIRASAVPVDGCDSCNASFAYDGLGWFKALIDDDAYARLQVQKFPIELELLSGFAKMPERHLSVSINFAAAESGIQFQGSGMGLFAHGGLETSLAFSLEGNIAERIQGRLFNIEVIRDQFEVSLPDVKFDRSSERLIVWLESADASSVIRAASSMISNRNVLGEWFAGLAPKGQISHIVFVKGDGGYGFEAYLGNLSTAPYLHAPAIQISEGAIKGSERGFLLSISESELDLSLPTSFDSEWHYENTVADVLFWWDPKYFGIHVEDLTALDQHSQLRGSMGFARNLERNEGHLTVSVESDGIGVSDAKNYMPNNLSKALAGWLQHRLVDGVLLNVRAVYQRHAYEAARPAWSRFKLTSDFDDAVVNYHDSYPTLLNGRGYLALNDDRTEIRFDRAVVFDVEMHEANVVVPISSLPIEVDFLSDTQVDRIFEFFWQTPLHEEWPAIPSQWTGFGPATVNTELSLGRTEQDIFVDSFNVQLQLNGADIDFNDYDLHLKNLKGKVAFTDPFLLTARDVYGLMFDAPVLVDIQSRRVLDKEQYSGTMEFHLLGNAGVEDVYRLIEMDNLEVVSGRTDFSAKTLVYMDSDLPPEVSIRSELVGVTVDLPVPLQKSAQQSWPMDCHLAFDDEYSIVTLTSSPLNAWLRTKDGEVLGGSAGISSKPSQEEHHDNSISLTGTIESFVLSESDTTLEWMPDLRLVDFEIGKIHLGTFEINNAAISGMVGFDEVDVSVRSDEMVAQISRHADDPWVISAESIRIPPTEADEGLGLLPLEVMDHLVPADVDVKDIVVLGMDEKTAHYGAWTFQLRPESGGIRLSNLEADLKGMNIEATGDVWWDRASNRTSASGAVYGANLAPVLVAWGFETNVESKTFHFEGKLDWPGSPLDYAVENISGDAGGTIKEGRFLDVSGIGGGVRLTSLLNFSTIVERLQLKFSDVVDTGISFKEVSVSGNFDDGLMNFVKPVVINGTGVEFRVNGTVDLNTGVLDNEMIVTLPLDESLPWYAAYAALANPAAGLGVLVGSKVFENHITTLSSGKYRVTGTIDDPKVKFISLFSGNLSNDKDSDSNKKEEKKP